MKSEITTIEHNELESPHAQEVEFALLLSRLISTVKQDPEQLRLTIYDFARTKLKNDLSWADESERQRLLDSLETAIRGVEKFSVRSDQLHALSPPPLAAHPALPDDKLVDVLNDRDGIVRSAPHLIDVTAEPDARPTYVPRRAAGGGKPILFALFGLLAGSVVAGSVYVMRSNLMQTSVLPQVTSPQAVAASPQVPLPARDNSPGFLVPSDYGVYALSEGKLRELDILPEQVPDKRVAMSTPVTQPSRTTLASGQVKFIVYRRDLSSNAPERVDIRIVAQVKRSLTFDTKGKVTFVSVNDAWNIRNISHEFRVRPVAGHPEMLLIQPENANFELPAGRYVLVLKTQGYDFTIAGPVTDPAQCLERTEAANGTFYSDCQKS